MKVAVVFDTPHKGWKDQDFRREMAAGVEEAEYEVAGALATNGHDVRLVGVHDDLRRLLSELAEFSPLALPLIVKPLAEDASAEICRTAFRALWLRDYARLDVRLTPDDQLWFIEPNANPFISFGHDMANAAEKAGLEYHRFIQRIMEEAVRRYARQP